MSKIQPRLSKIRRENVFYLDQNSFEDDISQSEKIISSLEIKKARCCCIVLDKDNKTCMCGLPSRQHYDDVIKNRQTISEWSVDQCVEENGLTDAYGDLEFVDNGDNLAKFIRVHHKTNMNKMLKVLFDYWKLNDPKLLISVTGGAQKFSLNPKLQECFRKGLVKAAMSTDAWISTGGLNVGVMKHVGEAIGENPNDKIVVLGIATWTMVLDNLKLINNGPSKDEIIHYSLSKPIEVTKKQHLDPNHTHFVLVDNAKHSYGGEIEFRAKLESAIANRNMKEPVPIVQLVLEGGPGTLDTVSNAIKEKIPCVFVDGSGKCADIFSFALKDIKDRENHKNEMKFVRVDDNLRTKLLKKIKSVYGDKNNEKLLETTIEILDEKNDHLLSVFDINKSDDIDIAILTSLLKAKENYKAQLKLALKWNRVDIARSYIFRDNTQIDTETMNEIMYEALLYDRVEFVRLILEHGFNLKNFLTWRRLLRLYNDLLPSSRLFSSYLVKIHKEKYLFDFKDIGKAIEKLVGHLYKSQFTHVDFSYIIAKETLEGTDEFGKAKAGVIQREYSVLGPHCGIDVNEKCDIPDHELFILFILNTRAEMSKIFWERGNNKMSSALIASKICKKYAKDYYEESDELNEISKEFEDMATQILEKCFEADERNSERLILRKITEYGGLNCIQIAAAAECKKFIAHICCQRFLTKLWYNKISPDNSKLKIAPCLVLPFLAPLILQYNEELIKNSSQKYNDEPLKREMTNGNLKENTNRQQTKKFLSPLAFNSRFHDFVQTPLVKFFYDQIFYIGFLILFSYVILCDFFPISNPRPEYSANLGISISPYECVLIIWVTSFAIHEIRQFFYTDSMVIKAKLKHFFSFWNGVEAFCIILYYIALILRFIPDSRDCYLASRILFAFDIIMWFMKSLSFYSVIRNLGPKLVMIKKMLIELVYFISIVLIFLFAFGVSTQALMYPNQKLSSNLLKQVFFPSYFVIGGEYYTLETIINADTCDRSNDSINVLEHDMYTQEDCPEAVGADVSLALYVAYLIILNILLVNLLIAIFSYTFQKIQDETDYVWKYQRYSLVHEYCLKPKLPAPFSLLSYLVLLVRVILRPLRKKCCPTIKSSETNVFKRFFWYLSKDSFSGFYLKLTRNENRSLMKWEKFHSEDWLNSKRKDEQENELSKLKETIKKIENDRQETNKKLDKIFEFMQNQTYKFQLEQQ